MDAKYIFDLSRVVYSICSLICKICWRLSGYGKLWHSLSYILQYAIIITSFWHRLRTKLHVEYLTRTVWKDICDLRVRICLYKSACFYTAVLGERELWRGKRVGISDRAKPLRISVRLHHSGRVQSASGAAASHHARQLRPMKRSSLK